MFFGREDIANLGNLKTMHYINNPDEPAETRTIDAKAEEIRRVFERLKRSAIIVPSRIVAKRANFSVANVHFSPGRDDLDGPAKSFLTGFSRDLLLGAGREPVDLYVLGLASDGKSEQEQWLLSARRAGAVADFLRDTLYATGGEQNRHSFAGGKSKWSIYSWGAGPGGDWVGPNSPISKHSQILIAVLRASD